ncbi:MAG: hypothetical protein P4L65_04520 [Legionella sp.]|nr:hypothetical protein [Legionella sp.]
MRFFEHIQDHLPNKLTSSTNHYVRASFGAVAAYSLALNPIAGALVLLSHGAWECAGLYMQTSIDQQQLRIDTYNKAFSKLLQQAKVLGSSCTNIDIQKAKNIFFVHNLIEEICYKALADSVTVLNIRGNAITEEQSGEILAYVKNITHIELRKEGGYSKKGREMISEGQFSFVLKNVSTIIHDRDTRLTDARYATLTDLCIALDDHNSYVKKILLNSWLDCKTLCTDTHLPMIKSLVHFNQKMSTQLGFDFEETLQESKQSYDRLYPNIREVKCPKTGETSAVRFVNVTEVKAKFMEHVEQIQQYDPDRLFTDCLVDYCSFTDEQVKELSATRSVSCTARAPGIKIKQPPLLSNKLTVGEFLSCYFPEVEKQEKLTARSGI